MNRCSVCGKEIEARRVRAEIWIGAERLRYWRMMHRECLLNVLGLPSLVLERLKGKKDGSKTSPASGAASASKAKSAPRRTRTKRVSGGDA